MSEKTFVTICRGFGKDADSAKEDAFFKAQCEGHDPESLDREWFRCANGNVGLRLYTSYVTEGEGNRPNMKAEVAA